MAFTVTTDLTTFVDAESDTPWTANGISADLDFFVQGTQSQSWNATKNGIRTVAIDPTDISHAAGDHVYFWMASSVAAKLEDKSTGTTTGSGLMLTVTLANGATRQWHVAGADTWGGEWRCFVVDLSHTGTQLYSSSGTWTTASNIDSMTISMDLSNSGNIRNAINTWNDAIRVGTGVTAYNTSAADAAFGYTDIFDYCEAVAQAYGISQKIGTGIYLLQGHVTIGDSASTNHVDFDSQDEIVIFNDRDGSGRGIVSTTLYGIVHTGNATGTDQDINYGVKVGTGDDMTGRNGTIIRAGGPNVDFEVDFSANGNLHNVTLYGVTVTGATGGVYRSTNPNNTFEAASCSFDGCGQVLVGSCTMRSCNFLNTVALSTEGALRWQEGQSDFEKCLFVNNVVAIEIATATGDITFTEINFQGNTNDVRYEGSGSYDLNIVDGTTPSILNAGPGTLTAVIAPVTTTVTVLDIDTELAIATAEVLVTAADGTGPLPYQDSVTITRSVSTATVAHTAHGLSTGQKVLIKGADQNDYNGVKVITVTGVNAYTYTVSNSPTTPATGTIVSTGVLIAANADVDGEVSDTRSLSSAQPITGRARSATSPGPYYKTAKITGTVSNTAGLETTVLMIGDE